LIPERPLEVLKAIVQDYIQSNEPVGSKSLVERHSFGVSAATIRNDMAILEEEELIAAPHTSSALARFKLMLRESPLTATGSPLALRKCS
jgi:transcriptional regulator of heat shock response